MISPQYTPFSGSEVRLVLGMPRHCYKRAVRIGELQKSVHFEYRISVSTSMHSLVDVVRYDVLFGKGWGNHLPGDHVEQCDGWLDALCDLQEGFAGFEQLIADRDYDAIMFLLLPEDGSTICQNVATTWSTGLTILFDVVSSWSYCSRSLSEMLASDRCKLGEAELRELRLVPRKHSMRYL